MPKEEVDEFVSNVPAHLRPVVDNTRHLIFEVYPEIDESIKWNQLVYELDGTNRFYLNYFSDHINLGFMKGSDVDDPHNLLEGSGKAMRHVKLHDPREVDRSALRALLKNAV